MQSISSLIPEKNTSQTQICQIVTCINENTGGTSVAVTSLAEALAQHDLSSNIFTLDYQQYGRQVEAKGVKVYSQPAGFLASKLNGFHLRASQKLFHLAATNFDLIHNHGLWMFPNLYARQAAIKNNLPLVISPRGMLEPWSLKRSFIRKRLAWLMYEKENLNKARLFHATSIEEVKSIRSLNLRQPIALIPDAVEVPNLNEQPDREIIVKDFPELANKEWLLFLSRLHPKKGLENLLYVWHKIAANFPDWHLVIAGSDLIGYKTKLELLITELELGQRVTFTGMLTGERKASVLKNTDLFVLPTHSENFGIVVAESLAYGVPVITTKGAPWEDLEHYECGWWIEDNQQALKITLVEAMRMSSSERKIMGLRGRKLVEAKYSWNLIAKEMASAYQWILTGGEPPNTIHLYNHR
jgi:glycosyltransferase involved in cell wall biosynthesis